VVSTLLSDEVPRYPLDKTTALHCLKKDAVTVAESPKGWMVAAFENTPVALLKNLGSRVNNYYPKEWRIRMRIE
jgi:NOL1/NOP2/fmu family ribosome biogenesis protein